MRLVLCSPCRPHGCVFHTEDVKYRQQAISEGATTTLSQRTTCARRQNRLVFWLCLEIVLRRQKARQLVRDTSNERSLALA